MRGAGLIAVLVLLAPVAHTQSARVERMRPLIPMGRVGQTEDLVGPVIFLASDMSAYVSGSIVMVDGGYRTV